MPVDRPLLRFSRKRIDEDKKLSWDFSNDMAAAETISTKVVTATVHSGTDASPGNIVSGSAASAGQVVTQLIVDGVDGVTYMLEFEITTSQSQTLHGVALLEISDTEAE